MNPIQAVKSCLSKYATFSGRASRSEYWWFALFNMMISVPLNIMLDSEDVSIALLYTFILFTLALIVPSIAVTVRRLHDVDYSGWWLLIPLVPFGFIFLFILTVARGDKGQNTYGLPPLKAS